ncbi:hypothetical protein WBG78_07410 [Chryseolinea sp. T2]|uniref:hypothetical protein n=1 Tax=Chryseolinea sp. T2 TaxID=3129255 RepID=UPI003077A6D5
MKKTTLLMAGMLFVGVSVSFAQQDTTSSQSQRRPAQVTQPAPASPSDSRLRDANQNYTRDMMKIQQSEIPDNLKATLQDAQYKGWENGVMYRTKTGDGYLIEMKDGSSTQVHRFDANGKPLKQ